MGEPATDATLQGMGQARPAAPSGAAMLELEHGERMQQHRLDYAIVQVLKKAIQLRAHPSVTAVASVQPQAPERWQRRGMERARKALQEHLVDVDLQALEAGKHGPAPSNAVDRVNDERADIAPGVDSVLPGPAQKSV